MNQGAPFTACMWILCGWGSNAGSLLLAVNQFCKLTIFLYVFQIKPVQRFFLRKQRNTITQ